MSNLNGHSHIMLVLLRTCCLFYCVLHKDGIDTKPVQVITTNYNNSNNIHSSPESGGYLGCLHDCIGMLNREAGLLVILCFWYLWRITEGSHSMVNSNDVMVTM